MVVDFTKSKIHRSIFAIDGFMVKEEGMITIKIKQDKKIIHSHSIEVTLSNKT